MNFQYREVRKAEGRTARQPPLPEATNHGVYLSFRKQINRSMARNLFAGQLLADDLIQIHHFHLPACHPPSFLGGLAYMLTPTQSLCPTLDAILEWADRRPAERRKRHSR